MNVCLIQVNIFCVCCGICSEADMSDVYKSFVGCSGVGSAGDEVLSGLEVNLPYREVTANRTKLGIALQIGYDY